MRLSTLFAPTLREVPAEAEIPSHRLMLRAGLMRKASAGIFTLLPLGLGSVLKIMAIIREEMNASGGQELLLPIAQPAELWRETGRWDEYGDEMFRLHDRHGRPYALGPTHEEIITALVRSEIRSYRQLPLLLYQMQDKFRDEIRPRFGVMRGREFMMKDAYSFDRDVEEMAQSYRTMYDAYVRIFARCGLETRAVEAVGGAIGGSKTHEFMVIADVGEAGLVLCTACEYAANVERAEVVAGTGDDAKGESTPNDGRASAQSGAAAGVSEEAGSESRGSAAEPERVRTPGAHTVDEVCGLLDVAPQQVLKTLIYIADGKPVAALVRGDHTLNELKLGEALGAFQLALADAGTVSRVTDAPVGFAGPVGLEGVPVIADRAAAEVASAVVGGNAADLHLRGVRPGTHFAVDRVTDLREAQEGDPCPRCGAPLRAARGIEVGQVFQLGTQYSEALGAVYVDQGGKEHPMRMGCYGIGVTRTLAAVIEQHHDEAGIIWPFSIAPYHVLVVPVNNRDEEQMRVAEEIYEAFVAAGVESVLDDRDERPGVKFKDADLAGYPIRLTVGPKGLSEGKVELKLRASGEERRVPVGDAVDSVRRAIDGEMSALTRA